MIRNIIAYLYTLKQDGETIAFARHANTNIIKALFNKYIASKLKKTRTTKKKMYFDFLCT